MQRIGPFDYEILGQDVGYSIYLHHMWFKQMLRICSSLQAGQV